MVESVFDRLQTNIYRKRLKFYSNTAQVFRLLHGIQSTETITIEQLKSLDSSSNLDSFVDVYSALLHDYYDTIKYDKGTEATNERLSYQKVIVVWKLLQAIFFSGFKKSTGYCYGTKIMTWLNYFDKRGLLRFDIQGVFNSDIPTNHTSFWPMTYKLILRGELGTLHKLFQVATERASDPYDKTILQSLTKLIQTFPVSTNDTVNIGDDETERHLASKRSIWRKQATYSLRELSTFKTARSALIKHATNTIDMLSGDITCLRQMAASSIEAIVASIYYYNHDNDGGNETIPFKPLTIRTINTVAQHIVDTSSTTSEQDQHVGLLALLKGNIYQAMEQCAQLDWWLLAHMSDILDRYTLQRQQNGLDDECSIGIFGGEPLYLHISGRQQAAKMESRVFFLLTYANTLVVQDDMWQTAFDYMGTCGLLGRSEISKAIQKIPMTNSNVALEVAAYCTRNGLVDERQRIYEEIAIQHDQQRHYDAAIRYYCLAGKYERLEDVFKNIFLRYCQERRLQSLDELDLRYKAECTGPQAQFYFGFYDMHTMYMERKLSEARKIAIDLILSVDSPDAYLPIVFLESITLMENCQDALPGEIIAQLEQRLNSTITSENKEGMRLVQTYLGDAGDNGTSDIADITSGLLDIYKLIIDRLSQ